MNREQKIRIRFSRYGWAVICRPCNQRWNGRGVVTDHGTHPEAVAAAVAHALREHGVVL